MYRFVAIILIAQSLNLICKLFNNQPLVFMPIVAEDDLLHHILCFNGQVKNKIIHQFIAFFLRLMYLHHLVLLVVYYKLVMVSNII